MGAKIFILLNLIIVIFLVRLLMKEKKTGKPSKLNLGKDSDPYGFGHSKQLNVVFNYNAESFDAYEILGIPAGSSMVEVKAAYEKLKDDPTQGEIVEKAFEAIKKSN